MESGMTSGRKSPSRKAPKKSAILEQLARVRVDGTVVDISLGKKRLTQPVIARSRDGKLADLRRFILNRDFVSAEAYILKLPDEMAADLLLDIFALEPQYNHAARRYEHPAGEFLQEMGSRAKSVLPRLKALLLNDLSGTKFLPVAFDTRKARLEIAESPAKNKGKIIEKFSLRKEEILSLFPARVIETISPKELPLKFVVVSKK